jgi:ribonuclease P protein component
LRQTFHKQERLCSRKQIEILFEEGKSAMVYPIKIVFLEVETPLIFPAQAMFVVPKKSFKKAHDRNLLKRRMRESYRLNKQTLYQALLLENKRLVIALIYIGKKEEDYEKINTSVIKLTKKLTDNDSV